MHAFNTGGNGLHVSRVWLALIETAVYFIGGGADEVMLESSQSWESFQKEERQPKDARKPRPEHTADQSE